MRGGSSSSPPRPPTATEGSPGRCCIVRSACTAIAARRRPRSNTDSRTGALGLYEKVGMRVLSSYTNYVKAFEPGERS